MYESYGVIAGFVADSGGHMTVTGIDSVVSFFGSQIGLARSQQQRSCFACDWRSIGGFPR